jgi:hypothetical protein
MRSATGRERCSALGGGSGMEMVAAFAIVTAPVSLNMLIAIVKLG